MQQPLYGLIGGKLGHSYSKIIHEQITPTTCSPCPPRQKPACLWKNARLRRSM